MREFALVTVAGCAAIVGGCGTAPVARPVAGANAPPAASAGGAPVNEASRPVNRALVSQGYRPTTYHGQLLYCRFEKLTGSQFSHKMCLTEQEAALQERIAQDEMMKRNSQGKCVQPLCDK
jgi:hypothetical protein